MHRLPPKGPIPTELKSFCRRNPTCNDWNTFYNNFHNSYETLKDKICSQQGNVCAYCEEQLPQEKPSQQRIEHFHPKEDKSSRHNWAFDWMNMLVTCHGGSRKNSQQPTVLHCDASKEQNVTATTCDGYLLNPLTMPSECLFTLNRVTGELQPNEDTCKNTTIPNNHYGSVVELVKETIRILNLNCDRLNEKRKKVIKEFEKERTEMRRNPKTCSSIRDTIAKKWFMSKTPSFFTTRRILLGKYAEQYI